jgi:hypothetical protein
MVIQGFLHDIQPRQARPTLELYFDTKDRSSFPRGERVPIVLELEGICLSGTMNSANSNNPPYVHTNLTLSNGTRRSCTELFLGLGLAEKARLEFELTNLNNLRLRRTIDRGGWRPGGAPDERIAGAIASDTRSAKSRLPQASPSISTPFPFDDRDEILKLAELYWNQISDGEAAEERAFEEEMRAARKAGFLTKSLFVRLGRWKSVRQTPNYEANDEANIRAATARAFTATDARSALSALMRLRGVALRTASALLHWMLPDRYPILDFRVVGALGKPEPRSYEDVGFYLGIAAEIKLLAQRHGLDLRTMDRALWVWQKLQTRYAR